MKLILLLLVTICLTTSARVYDRCDDLCRVLGFTQGGSCQGESASQCICNPGTVDATATLPTICALAA